MSASDALDLYKLAPHDLLTTEQVGALGPFGKSATLTHNRCVGRPGPVYVKLGSRVFYRVSALLAYLDEQQTVSEVACKAKELRFRALQRGAKIAA